MHQVIITPYPVSHLLIAFAGLTFTQTRLLAGTNAGRCHDRCHDRPAYGEACRVLDVNIPWDESMPFYDCMCKKYFHYPQCPLSHSLLSSLMRKKRAGGRVASVCVSACVRACVLVHVCVHGCMCA